jgi:hypothetical protein
MVLVLSSTVVHLQEKNWRKRTVTSINAVLGYFGEKVHDDGTAQIAVGFEIWKYPESVKGQALDNSTHEFG